MDFQVTDMREIPLIKEELISYKIRVFKSLYSFSNDKSSLFFFLVCFLNTMCFWSNVALFEQRSLLLWMGEWAQLYFGRSAAVFPWKLATSFGLAKGYILPFFTQSFVAVNRFTKLCCSFNIKGLYLFFPADATTQSIVYEECLQILTSAYSWNGERPSPFQ